MAGIGKVMDEVKKAVVGKDAVLLRAVLAILADGHILLEDVPGVGKTTMALAFSKALGLRYNRMQFTPDVLPSDVTGFSLYNKAVGKMEYQPGAVLCNLFLADELNRATSRTQAALLEAMEEGQVTVDGVTHALPRPFIVIATQNPAGAQTDQVYVSDEVLDYIVRLVAGTRTLPELVQGASPRATLAVAAMAKAAALARGADYVTPADVRRIFHCTVAHRLIPAPQTRDVDALLDDLMRSISAPQLK